MSFVADEIASQPALWHRATQLATAGEVAGALPARGERVAIVGCGTSYYIAQAAARRRETAGHGETDAFPASEFPPGRGYDRVVALTRSGTTTEVVRLLERLRGRTTVISTGADHPAARAAAATVVLDFADERSVVQTRFATTALALWRAHLGEDLSGAIGDAEHALAAGLPDGLVDRSHFTFLGTGWSVGLAAEAALKLREAAQAWTESYPAMELRHGPISVLDERSAAYFLADPPDGLADEIAATGALVVHSPADPMARLIGAQQLAVRLAERRGLDPDAPRNLTRSIVLDS
jgi:fructoselysine-6-P-deglycase FrlB-like protein